MTLDEFCDRYEVTDRERRKLEIYLTALRIEALLCRVGPVPCCGP